MHWLYHINQNSADNLNTVRREANRQFRKKNKEYLKAKINLKLTIRRKLSETCVMASILRRVIGLDFI